MTTLNEEARWAKLRTALEERLSDWRLDAASERAEGIVRDLRRSGWRIPLPDHQARNELWARRPTLRPEAVQRHAAACREALRETQGKDIA